MDAQVKTEAADREQSSHLLYGKLRTRSVSIGTLAQTVNRAIEQADQLGLPAAAQLLMMARLEVDLTEIAIATEAKRLQADRNR